MSYTRRGMGMYPDETCFDPTRPSWLPNWLDDVSESECKVNMLVSGNTTGNTAQPGAPGAAAATIQAAAASCAYGGGSWDPSTNICTPSPIGQLNQYLPVILLGLGAMILIPMFMGRR